MKYIAIDPGLDAMGLARFEVTGPVAGGMFERLKHLTGFGAVRTAAKLPLADRLQALAQEAAAAAAGADLVLIERPTIAGLYARHQGLERALSKSLAAMWMASGAIIVGARGAAPVELVPASREPKHRRRQLLQSMFTAAKRADLVELRDPDVLDAIWLGLLQLPTGVRSRNPPATLR